MTRTDRYWAAIARDHAQGDVDAVTRLADEEIAVVQAENASLRRACADWATSLDQWITTAAEARCKIENGALQKRLDDAEARVDALTDELATVRDTLEKRTAAHGRLVEVVDRVRALADEWQRDHDNDANGRHGYHATEYGNYYAADVRAALDEVTP